MVDASKQHGDEVLDDLFDEFDGRLISPGGAAALLGLSRKTIYTLGEREVIRVFRGQAAQGGDGYKWVYIPLDDIGEYARRVGRPVPKVCQRP